MLSSHHVLDYRDSFVSEMEGLPVLYRSKCTDGIVIDGKCKIFKVKDAARHEPCKGRKSCIFDDKVCVRNFCHKRCAKGKTCKTVDGESIVQKKDSCDSLLYCETFGDEFCNRSRRVCDTKAAEGGKCVDAVAMHSRTTVRICKASWIAFSFVASLNSVSLTLIKTSIFSLRSAGFV